MYHRCKKCHQKLGKNSLLPQWGCPGNANKRHEWEKIWNKNEGVKMTYKCGCSERITIEEAGRAGSQKRWTVESYYATHTCPKCENTK